MGRRGTTPAAIALWVAATGVAVAAAGGAVRVVTSQVLEPLPPPTIATTETDVLAEGRTDVPGPTPSTGPSTEPSDVLTTSPSPSASTTTSRPAPQPNASEDDHATDRPTEDDHATDGPTEDDHATDGPTEDDHPTDEPTSDAPSEAATDDSSEGETDRATDADPVVRTVTSEGGSASFEWVDGRVRLRWATPREGFRVAVEEEPGEITVEFFSVSHESRIKADWEDGRPRVRVEERPRDGVDDRRD